MNGIQTLRSRNTNQLIEREFVKNILQEEGQNIEEAQNRVFAEVQTNNKIELARYSREFTVNGNTLRLDHNIQQRFIDMKRTRYGAQKPVKVHNSIIFGHWNNIVFRSKVELTQALRNQIRFQLKLEV